MRNLRKSRNFGQPFRLDSHIYGFAHASGTWAMPCLFNTRTKLHLNILPLTMSLSVYRNLLRNLLRVRYEAAGD